MKRILFALILLSLSTSSFADRIPIAILNLDAKGVGLKKGVADVVTESVRYEFSKQKDFDLVAREKMDQLAREKAIQLSGCTDISCAVQVGKALNVKKIVVGSVGKLGQKYLVFLRVVDVEKENVECSDKGEGEVEWDPDLSWVLGPGAKARSKGPFPKVELSLTVTSPWKKAYLSLFRALAIVPLDKGKYALTPTVKDKRYSFLSRVISPDGQISRPSRVVFVLTG